MWVDYYARYLIMALHSLLWKRLIDRIPFVEVDRPIAPPMRDHATAPKRTPRPLFNDRTGGKRATPVFRLPTQNSEEASFLVSAVCRSLDVTMRELASLVHFPAILHPVRMHRIARPIVFLLSPPSIE